MFKALVSVLLIAVASAGATAEPRQVKPVQSSSGRSFTVPPSNEISSAEIAPVSRTKLILLGTAGGPVVKSARSQPATAIVVDGRVYLFDVGNGALRQLAKAGFGVRDLAGVFITHNHFDHDAELGAVMAFRWFSRPSAPLPIFGPPGTRDVGMARMAAFRHSQEIFQSEVPAILAPEQTRDFPITEGVEGLMFKDERVTVTATENSHYVAVRPGTPAAGRDRSISYRIQTPDRIIVITGDTGRSEAVVRLAQGADILVSEVLDADAILVYVTERAKVTNASPLEVEDTLRHHYEGHLLALDLGRLAAAAKVGSVVMTHFVPTEPSSLDTRKLVNDVRRSFSGPVVAGVDLQVF